MAGTTPGSPSPGTPSLRLREAPVARKTASYFGLEIGQREVAAHGAVELELHAEADDAVDLRAQHGAREAVLRDADGHHAARHGHRLEDGHSVAETGEVVGGRHSGRPAADDGDLLRALARRRGDRRQLALLSRKSLEAANGDRFVEGAAPADRLARSGADPAADRREGVDFGRDRIGLVVAALGDQPDVTTRVRPGRTGFLARRDGIAAAVGDHRPPDLPVVRSLAGSPLEQAAPRRHASRLEQFARDVAERLPVRRRLDGPRDGALARGQRRRARDRVEQDDVSGALAHADAAADALADLDRVLHHPFEGPAEDAGAFDSGPLRAAHVQRLNRADVHAHAAVQAVAVLDLDPIAHETPRP